VSPVNELAWEDFYLFGEWGGEGREGKGGRRRGRKGKGGGTRGKFKGAVCVPNAASANK